MLTKKDIQTLKEVFATKQDLQDLKKSLARYVTKDYLDLQFEVFEGRLDEKFEDLFKRRMDQVFQNFDIVIGEIRAMREEMAAASFRLMEHTTQIDNHEERIGKLETGALAVV